MIVFVGRPGAGKTSFFKKYLSGIGYVRVNQDSLGSLPKCQKEAQDLLAKGKSIVIDNTNRDAKTREVWVRMAQNAKIPVQCIWFQTDFVVCKHNDAVRAFNKSMRSEDLKRDILPLSAWESYNKVFEEPRVEEGFQQVTKIPFKFRGTRDEHSIWAKYWAEFKR